MFCFSVGPCTSKEMVNLRNCTLTDVLGDVAMLQNSSKRNQQLIDLIINTYFAEDKDKELINSTTTDEEQKGINIRLPTANEKKINQMESKELFYGSSSWPWNREKNVGAFNLPETCFCLTNKEIFEMTGLHVDFEPCTQPIPWCYVRNGADCYDQVEYKRFGAKCPDCILGDEKEDDDSTPSNVHIISWSVAACSKEKIPEVLKKPYFF